MNKKYSIGSRIFFKGENGWPAMQGIVISKNGSNRVRVQWDIAGAYGVGKIIRVWVNLTNIYKVLF